MTVEYNRKRAEELQKYLNTTNTTIRDLYKSPEKVISDLAHLAKIK